MLRSRRNLDLALVAAVILLVGAAVPALAAHRIRGNAGPNVLRGTPRADRLFGRGGDDRLFGGRGNDRLYGGIGDDRLVDGAGNDKLYGGPGHDEFNTLDGQRVKGSGVGDDRIEARDGETDTIDCGPGQDVAVVDAAEEGVYDCETVVYPESR
jgi:Ca2+-binding RTX toxin-like protein